MELYQALLKYNDSGTCCLPCDLQAKFPKMLSSWQNYQHNLPTDYDKKIWRNYSDVDRFGVCLICGNISGGLEVIDIDNHLGNADQLFKDFISIDEVAGIISKYDLPIEQTKSGGYHIFFKSECPDGNLKLAKESGKTTIETRGEGGLIVCAPSKGYTIISGDLSDIATISCDERNALIMYSRAYDKDVAVSQPVFSPTQQQLPANTGERPGDIYNAQYVSEAISILKSMGWTQLGNKHWRRPNKKDGVSATFGHIAPDVFYVFSSNAYPFESNRCYHPFDIYTLCEHNGDYKTSATVIADRLGMKKEKKAVTSTKADIVPDDDAQVIPAEIQIWREVGKQNKIKIDFWNLKEWLELRGYMRVHVGNGKYEFAQIINNVIFNRTFKQVRDEILFYLKGIDRKDVYNEFMEDTKFSENTISNLREYDGRYLRDSATTCFFFYTNCYLEITRNSIAKKNYRELEIPIWEKQIVQRAYFDTEDYRVSDAYNFCKVITNKSEERLNSLMSAIGYNLHRYKNPAQCPVVILTDENVTDEANGGTGKGIIFEFIKKIRNVDTIDAKKYDEKNKFALQRVSFDTDLIHLDDIPRGFNFESLFSAITTGLTVEPKGKKEIYMDFSVSPKISIASNYPLKTKGDSFARRMFIVEIFKYFGSNYTPMDEFGRIFFTGWDEDEWCRFDRFMVECVLRYFRLGLKPVRTESLRINVLKANTRSEFVDFAMENLSIPNIYNKSEMLAKFREYTDDGYYKNHLGTRQFTEWCKEWSDFNGWEFDRRCGAQGGFFSMKGDVARPNPNEIEFKNNVDEIPF